MERTALAQSPISPSPHVPTMLELAHELNLSRRTVSSVVNGKAAERNISEATALRVRAHLAARGYVPSKQALALKSGARGAVGILHSGRLYSHLVEAFNRLVDASSAQPEGVEIVVTPRSAIASGFRELVSRGVSKIVWIQSAAVGTELLQADELLPMFAGRSVVIYNHRFGVGDWDRRLIQAGAYLVGVDRSAAYAMQAKFLMELGHRQVALADATSIDGRADDAKVTAFRQAGLEPFGTCPKSVQMAGAGEVGSTAEAGAAMARAVSEFRRTTPVTAAVFQDDLVAGFALAEWRRQGIDVPRDLTVMGFDGLEITGLMSPALTTLRIPVPAMVNRVLRILKRPPTGRRHCFEIEMTLGTSHAPVARGWEPRAGGIER